MKVTIKNRNQAFDCDEGESVLDAALRQGITMPYGCRSGRCGNCMGTLVNGEIEYPNGPPPALEGDDISAKSRRLTGCSFSPASMSTLSSRTVVDVHFR